MPRLRKKKKKASKEISGIDAEKGAEKALRRAGLPEEDAIIEEKSFVSPSGKKYRILITDETDEYEESKTPSPPEDDPL